MDTTTTYAGLASGLYPDTAETAPPAAAPSTAFADAERQAARLYRNGTGGSGPNIEMARQALAFVTSPTVPSAWSIR